MLIIIGKLPNELIAQLDGRDFNLMSKKEQIEEVKWCIERCYMNIEEYSDDDISKFISDIKKLKRILSKLGR